MESTENTPRFGIWIEDSGWIRMEKFESDAKLADFVLEISEDVVSEHVYMDQWSGDTRFTEMDQSFPQLQSILVRASEEGRVRL